MKVGVLSLAHMHAYSYLNCLKAIPGVELGGIADEDVQRGELAAREFGTIYYRKYETLLDAPIDAVVVTSENARHCEMTIAAAEAGKHILCEKPIASTCEDAEHMIEACAKHNVKFQMAFPCRYLTPLRQVKELIDSGRLGRIYAMTGTNHGRMPGEWFVQKRLSGGGAVLDHSVHVVDLMRWLSGAEVQRVYAQVDTRFHQIEVDDCGALVLDFDGGIFATLDPSWSRPKSFPTWGDVTLEIVAEGGTILVDAFKQIIEIYSDEELKHYVSFWGDNMNMGLVEDFVRCVRTDSPPTITGIDGLRALEVAVAAYESARSGVPVTLDRL